MPFSTAVFFIAIKIDLNRVEKGLPLLRKVHCCAKCSSFGHNCSHCASRRLRNAFVSSFPGRLMHFLLIFFLISVTGYSLLRPCPQTSHWRITCRLNKLNPLISEHGKNTFSYNSWCWITFICLFIVCFNKNIPTWSAYRNVPRSKGIIEKSSVWLGTKKWPKKSKTYWQRRTQRWGC